MAGGSSALVVGPQQPALAEGSQHEAASVEEQQAFGAAGASRAVGGASFGWISLGLVVSIAFIVSSCRRSNPALGDPDAGRRGWTQLRQRSQERAYPVGMPSTRRPKPRRRGRVVLACLHLLVLLLVALPGHALTEPISGAVPLPVGVDLRLPFPEGAAVRVLSGYGPAGGSSLHADTDRTDKANDHYALDLVYDDEPDSGKGLPIVAPLAGTVVVAGWSDAGWANYGLRVYLSHDLGDGHEYISLYAHLDSIEEGIEEGAQVAQGQPLGTLGQSCQGALSCGSFGTPHLHWVLHRNSTVGGSGSGGSYGGNAVVPEAIDGYEDLQPGDVLISSNSGEVVCGDGYCNGGETNESCPADCPVCEPVPPEGRTIDETDLCFTRAGSPEYWNEETDVGHDGTLLWTHATDDAVPDDTGTWRLAFEAAGTYRIDAWIEPGFAGSVQAPYAVSHDGGVAAVVVDQSAADGWTELGEFAFSADADHAVTLVDNTGESFDLMRRLAFDAVRVVPIDVPTTTSVGSGGSGPTGAGGDEPTATGAGGDDGAPTGGGASDPGDGGSGPGEDGSGGADDAAADGDEGGCGCVTAGAPTPSGGWAAAAALAVLTLLGTRRRRPCEGAVPRDASP